MYFGNNGTHLCIHRFLWRIKLDDQHKALCACTSRSTINVASSFIILQDLSWTSLHCFHQSLSSSMASQWTVSSPCGLPLGVTVQWASKQPRTQGWAPPHCSHTLQTSLATPACPVLEQRSPLEGVAWEGETTLTADQHPGISRREESLAMRELPENWLSQFSEKALRER